VFGFQGKEVRNFALQMALYWSWIMPDVFRSERPQRPKHSHQIMYESRDKVLKT
jgi:hypothetical protein